MSHHFAFVHGWGSDFHFWDALLAFFPRADTTKIDLGFIGTEHLVRPHRPAIYVTHSLGTLWSLKNHSAHMSALVSINGFYRFKDFVPARILETMKVRLKTEPAIQMKEFWEISGLPPHHDLNRDQLACGLDWLSSWDARKELESLNCPVLSLAGDQDPLLPLDKMKAHWAGFDLRVKKGGGHALPLTEPQWCARQIAAQIKEFSG